MKYSKVKKPRQIYNLHIIIAASRPFFEIIPWPWLMVQAATAKPLPAWISSSKTAVSKARMIIKCVFQSHQVEEEEASTRCLVGCWLLEKLPCNQCTTALKPMALTAAVAVIDKQQVSWKWWFEGALKQNEENRLEHFCGGLDWLSMWWVPRQSKEDGRLHVIDGLEEPV